MRGRCRTIVQNKATVLAYGPRPAARSIERLAAHVRLESSGKDTSVNAFHSSDWLIKKIDGLLDQPILCCCGSTNPTRLGPTALRLVLWIDLRTAAQRARVRDFALYLKNPRSTQRRKLPRPVVDGVAGHSSPAA